MLGILIKHQFKNQNFLLTLHHKPKRLALHAKVQFSFVYNSMCADNSCRISVFMQQAT